MEQRTIFRRNSIPKFPESDERCQVKFQCGSCRFVNQPYDYGLEKKYQEALIQIKEAIDLSRVRLMPPVSSVKQLAYRAYTKLAVRPIQAVDGASSIGIGLFAKASHDLVDIVSCPLHFPEINALLVDLKSILINLSLLPYDEAKHTGDIRYLTVRINRSTKAMSLLIVANNIDVRDRFKELAKELRKQHKLSALYLNVNSQVTNSIFGPDTELIWGYPFSETFCGFSIEFGPVSFSQVNLHQAENIYRRIEQIVGQAPPEGAVAWDFYCGVGQISCVLSRLGFEVLAIEENPDAIQRAEQNFRRNSLKSRSLFLAGRVGEQMDEIPVWASSPRVIVVNPSRKGLEDEARLRLGGILSSASPTLVYVSCDLQSLIRDIKDLERYGYKLRQIESFDMFAQTDKLEWLGVLTP